MTFTTSAGTTISISASLPANYNKAGYEALAFTEIGEVTDLGDIPSEVFELVRHQPIKTRGVQKKKGGKDMGSQTIQFAINPDDAGQAMLRAAATSDNPRSIKIDHPEIGTIYAPALVMGVPWRFGDVNTASNASATLEYTYGPNGESFVLVPAA